MAIKPLKPLKLDLSDLDEKMTLAVAELRKSYPLRISEDGIPVMFKKVKNSEISTTFRNGVCEIEADSAPHFYFALSMLLLKSQTIEDSLLYSRRDAQRLLEFRMDHVFTKNGLMLDLSRNAVAHIDMLKQLIREMAFMGHSWFMLYMEDVYEVEGAPYFGALRGRYSIKDLQELDRYAQIFGVQLVPCIQTLAHMDQYFMWEAIEYKYKDIDNIFNIANAEVRVLLTRMIASLRKAFSSDIIHIGMDEAHNLGRGRYLDENGLKQKRNIMEEHLAFMKNLCKTYGFKPIVWDDMFFGRYSNNKENTEPIIPHQVGLMYWDYYSCLTKHYRKHLQVCRALTKKTMFAGGAWRWTGYIPHHKKTLETTLAAIEACRKEKVKEVIVTSWGDDGSEAPLYTCMFGLVLFAYLDCHPKYQEAGFAQYLRLYTGMGLDEWMRQGEPDLFEGTTGNDYDITPSKYLLYQDPLGSKFLYYIRTLTTDMDAVYKKLEQAFTEDAANTDNPLQRSIAEFYALMMKTLYYKWRLPLDIWEAYKKADKRALQALIEKKIQPLKMALAAMAKARRRVWMEECRGFGSEVLDHRFGAMLMRLEVTQELLADYIQGKITHIDELEEERLDPCPEANKTLEPQAVRYNRALRIMTACRETW
ncbi:beta-N-acetylhexosaminidase [Treponema sp. OMZ 305]|uniref:beta-N-acetylhexosaminidase n=1 Tax=Treponema sp. OMZ 305 TaxID=1659192 RepID=UPI0020A4799C|nr:beta-N-acetylhexosaminidase [Treponema sp. OMZ 305]